MFIVVCTMSTCSEEEMVKEKKEIKYTKNVQGYCYMAKKMERKI